MPDKSFVTISHKDFSDALVDITADERPDVFQGNWQEMLLQYIGGWEDLSGDEQIAAILAAAIHSAYNTGYNAGYETAMGEF